MKLGNEVYRNQHHYSMIRSLITIPIDSRIQFVSSSYTDVRNTLRMQVARKLSPLEINIKTHEE